MPQVVEMLLGVFCLLWEYWRDDIIENNNYFIIAYRAGKRWRGTIWIGNIKFLLVRHMRI